MGRQTHSKAGRKTEQESVSVRVTAPGHVGLSSEDGEAGKKGRGHQLATAHSGRMRGWGSKYLSILQRVRADDEGLGNQEPLMPYPVQCDRS